MNHKVPQSLPQLGFRDPVLCWPARPVCLWEGTLSWDSHSQHWDVPKDSRVLLSPCPLPLWLLPIAVFEAQSICPMGTPVDALKFIPASVPFC